MTGQVPDDIRNAVLKLLHARTDSDAAIDELQSILLQIALAVMLIFMIAFFLFMSKVDGKISRIDEMEQKITESEQARILLAVNQTKEYFRIRYAVSKFMQLDEASGKKSFDIEGVMKDGRLNSSGTAGLRFKDGANNAFQDYSDPDGLQNQWMAKTASICKMPDFGKSPFAVKAVQDGIREIREEAAELQTMAVSEIQTFLAEHPSMIQDADIRALAAGITKKADSPDRKAQLRSLAWLLKRYARSRLVKEGGILMLPGEDQ